MREMGKAARTSHLDTERTQTCRESEGLKQSHNRYKSDRGMTVPSGQGETGEGNPTWSWVSLSRAVYSEDVGSELLRFQLMM